MTTDDAIKLIGLKEIRIYDLQDTVVKQEARIKELEAKLVEPIQPGQPDSPKGQPS